jgi:hypothetical protein
MVMKNKMMVLIGALAMAGMLCACATTGSSGEKTSDQVAAEAEKLLKQMVKLGKQIKQVGGPGQSQIVCACIPPVKPDKPGGPGGPRTAAEIEDIARALQVLQKVSDAEAAGQTVQFVAPAAKAVTH